MREPDGAKLLATLIELLAEQNGVKITYVIEKERNKKMQRVINEVSGIRMALDFLIALQDKIL